MVSTNDIMFNVIESNNIDDEIVSKAFLGMLKLSAVGFSE